MDRKTAEILEQIEEWSVDELEDLVEAIENMIEETEENG